MTTTAAVSRPIGLTGTDAMNQVEGVSKAFGSVQALADGDGTVRVWDPVEPLPS